MTIHYEDYEMTDLEEARYWGSDEDAQLQQEEYLDAAIDAAAEAAVDALYENCPEAWSASPATEYLKWLDTIAITEAVFQRLMKDRDGEAAK